MSICYSIKALVLQKETGYEYMCLLLYPSLVLHVGPLFRSLIVFLRAWHLIPPLLLINFLACSTFSHQDASEYLSQVYS